MPHPGEPIAPPQESFATVQEQTANTTPAAEEALAGAGAGSAVAVECGPCPTGRGPDLAIADTAGAMRRVGGPSLNV